MQNCNISKVNGKPYFEWWHGLGSVTFCPIPLALDPSGSDFWFQVHDRNNATTCKYNSGLKLSDVITCTVIPNVLLYLDMCISMTNNKVRKPEYKNIFN